MWLPSAVLLDEPNLGAGLGEGATEAGGEREGVGVEAELGVAFFVAAYSALRKAPVSPALLILGDLSVQGNIKPLRSLVEPLQVAKDNGAKRALIPVENKRNFLEVSGDIVEVVDPVFYGEPKAAAMKVLGMG